MKIIDTHAHLDHLDNIDIALTEAYDSGVSGIIAASTDLESSKKNLSIKKTKQKPLIFAALGIHPESLEVYDDQVIENTLRFIEENAGEAIAVGEIGLDYWYKWARKDSEKKDQQRDVFRRQLALARKLELPVIIHSRGAWRDCLDFTKKAGIKKAVFHWYSGPLDVLSDIIACGYFISATPALHYSEPLKKAVEQAPIEQMFIETDSPVYYRYEEEGFSATPKDVFRTLRLYAAIKGIPQDDAAGTLNRNAKEFFGITAC